MPGPSFEALAVSSGCKAHVWQPFSKEPDLNYFAVTHDSKVYAVQWNQNNKVVVSAGATGILRLNYNRDGAVMGVLGASPEDDAKLPAVNSLGFSRGSKLLASGCSDSTVRVWDLKQQACKQKLESHKAAVCYVTYSPDDAHLASAGLTGEIHLHTTKEGNPAAVLRTPGNRAKRSLHYSTIEALLASGSEDGSLYVWDTSTYTLLDSYVGTHQGAVSRVCFSPVSPNILISASLDRMITLTDRRLDATVATVECAAPLTALDCRDDGNCIGVGTANGLVLLYDPRKLQQPSLQLTCPGGEMVTGMHWQQSVAVKPTRRHSRGGERAATPATPAQKRPQDLLNAASPATPFSALPSRPSGQEAWSALASTIPANSTSGRELSESPSPPRSTGPPASHSEPIGEQPGMSARSVPMASEQSLSVSERQQQRRTSTKQRGVLLPAESRPEENEGRAQAQSGAKTSPFSKPDASSRAAEVLSHVSSSGKSTSPEGSPTRAEVSAQRELDRKAAAAASRELSAAKKSSRTRSAEVKAARATSAEEIKASSATNGSAAANEESALATPNGRASANGQAGSHSGVKTPSLQPAQRVPAEAASALFRSSGDEQDGASGLPSQVALQGMADEITSAISADIRTLHFEMIRQFHIQQMETKELIEAMVAQQDNLVKEVSQLRARVQQLTQKRDPNVWL